MLSLNPGDIGSKNEFGLCIVPSSFSGSRKSGDFEWEIRKNIRPTALYLFNDNVEHHTSSSKGGGNAAIRPWNQFGRERPVRSAGIPTGTMTGGGFTSLSDAKQHVDAAIGEVEVLLSSGMYDTVVYSCVSKNDDALGTGIFQVATEVKDYIRNRIYGLGKTYRTDSICSSNNVDTVNNVRMDDGDKRIE